MCEYVLCVRACCGWVYPPAKVSGVVCKLTLTPLSVPAGMTLMAKVDMKSRNVPGTRSRSRVRGEVRGKVKVRGEVRAKSVVEGGKVGV